MWCFNFCFYCCLFSPNWHNQGVSLSSVMTAESSLLPFVPPYTQSHERLEREVVYLVHGHCPTLWLAQHTQLIMFQKIADNKKFLSIQQKKVNWCLPRHACNPLIFREANGKYRMTICELWRLKWAGKKPFCQKTFPASSPLNWLALTSQMDCVFCSKENHLGYYNRHFENVATASPLMTLFFKLKEECDEI